MLPPDSDCQDAGERPITRKEMLVLVEPLQSCLQRMENKLEELVQARCAFVADGGDGLSETGIELAFPIPENHIPEEAILENDVNKSSDDRTHKTGFHKLVAHGTLQDVTALAQTEPVPITKGGEAAQRTHIRQDFHKGEMGFVERYRIYEELELDAELSLVEKVLNCLDKIAHKWSSIQEPQRSGWTIRLIRSNSFEMTCRCAIFLNALLLAYTTNWEIQNIDMRAPRVLNYFESIFRWIFAVELILRLAAHRLYFFVNDDMKWNIFDFLLVCASMFEFILETTGRSQNGPNLSLLRMIRLCKIGRVLRSMRLFRLVVSLSTMMDSLKGSLVSLFWGLILLGFILYVLALICMSGLAGYLKENYVDPDVKHDIDHYFGSFTAATLSLYASVTGGDDWSVCFELINKAGWIYGLFFVIFITFTAFAVFNLITGQIVEEALASAHPNRCEQILQQRKKKQEQKNEFLEICKKMDLNSDAKISWSEFKEWIKNPVMSTYMASIGVDVYDVELFFATVGARSISKGRGAHDAGIPFEHFVDGCMHMRGEATAIDMQRQLFETHIILEELRHLAESVTERFQHVEEFVGSCFNTLRPSKKHRNTKLMAGTRVISLPGIQPIPKSL